MFLFTQKGRNRVAFIWKIIVVLVIISMVLLYAPIF